MKLICTLEHAISHCHSGLWTIESRSSSQTQQLSCQWRALQEGEWIDYSRKSDRPSGLVLKRQPSGLVLKRQPCSLLDILSEHIPEIAFTLFFLLILAVVLFPHHHC